MIFFKNLCNGIYYIGTWILYKQLFYIDIYKILEGDFQG